jgi:hypothetical protein
LTLRRLFRRGGSTKKFLYSHPDTYMDWCPNYRESCKGSEATWEAMVEAGAPEGPRSDPFLSANDEWKRWRKDHRAGRIIRAANAILDQYEGVEV